MTDDDCCCEECEETNRAIDVLGVVVDGLLQTTSAEAMLIALAEQIVGICDSFGLERDAALKAVDDACQERERDPDDVTELVIDATEGKGEGTNGGKPN